MRISAQGIALIKHFEGFSPTPYRCPAGYLTIGYGHVLTGASGKLKAIDEAAAEQLLRADLRLAEAAIARLISRPLNPCQFDALASFTYNLGSGALQRSALRRVINRGDDGAVPSQLCRWVYTGGRKLPGLVRRRIAEAALYQGFSSISQSRQNPQAS